jgi:hypothetical protein
VQVHEQWIVALLITGHRPDAADEISKKFPSLRPADRFKFATELARRRD